MKISPHVQIYKFPITALSSITNRVTGLAFTGIYVASGVSLLFNVDVQKYYSDMRPASKTFINYGVLFPAIYHTYGGLRHMIWDKYPNLLQNMSVKRSSIALFLLSAGTTALYEQYVIRKDLKNIL